MSQQQTHAATTLCHLRAHSVLGSVQKPYVTALLCDRVVPCSCAMLNSYFVLLVSFRLKTCEIMSEFQNGYLSATFVSFIVIIIILFNMGC